MNKTNLGKFCHNVAFRTSWDNILRHQITIILNPRLGIINKKSVLTLIPDIGKIRDEEGSMWECKSIASYIIVYMHIKWESAKNHTIFLWI